MRLQVVNLHNAALLPYQTIFSLSNYLSTVKSHKFRHIIIWYDKRCCTKSILKIQTHGTKGLMSYTDAIQLGHYFLFGIIYIHCFTEIDSPSKITQ